MSFRTMCTRFHTPPGYDYIWPVVVAIPILVAPIPKLHMNCGNFDYSMTNDVILAMGRTHFRWDM